MNKLSSLKITISNIHLFIILIILGFLVCVNTHKAGGLMIGIPDYVVTSVLLVVLTPFANVDLMVVKVKYRLGGLING